MPRHDLRDPARPRGAQRPPLSDRDRRQRLRRRSWSPTARRCPGSSRCTTSLRRCARSRAGRRRRSPRAGTRIPSGLWRSSTPGWPTRTTLAGPPRTSSSGSARCSRCSPCCCARNSGDGRRSWWAPWRSLPRSRSAAWRSHGRETWAWRCSWPSAPARPLWRPSRARGSRSPARCSRSSSCTRSCSRSRPRPARWPRSARTRTAASASTGSRTRWRRCSSCPASWALRFSARRSSRSWPYSP